MDLDPDNEFEWTDEIIEKMNQRFSDLISSKAGQELSDYSLRCIGTELEGTIRKLLQSGELKYNSEGRVMNYSMGLPRTPKLL